MVCCAEPEPIDAQQRATLQEVHLQQIAGITDMIQGVKDNLMQQQTLKHNIKQDASLEVYEKIGGGGFGEVFKGSFKGVRAGPASFALHAHGLLDATAICSVSL